MAYSDKVNRMIFDRLEAGQTCDTIASAMGVSRALVSIRRRSMANPPPRKVPFRGREDKFSTKRNPHEAAAALWEKVLETAIREGDLVWLFHDVEDAGTVGTFTWVAISLGAEPDDLLTGIDYEDLVTPVFPRHGDGSVILWDWTEHDATEERIEERDAAGGGDGDVTGPDAPGAERAGVRGSDGRPRWDEGGWQDPCCVGA
jgi:hypothetical protein